MPSSCTGRVSQCLYIYSSTCHLRREPASEQRRQPVCSAMNQLLSIGGEAGAPPLPDLAGLPKDWQSQANSLWKMLDDLAESDPQAYAKFIQVRARVHDRVRAQATLRSAGWTRRLAKPLRVLRLALCYAAEPGSHSQCCSCGGAGQTRHPRCCPLDWSICNPRMASAR